LQLEMNVKNIERLLKMYIMYDLLQATLKKMDSLNERLSLIRIMISIVWS